MPKTKTINKWSPCCVANNKWCYQMANSTLVFETKEGWNITQNQCIAECYATGTAKDGVASSCHQQTAAVDRSWNAFAMVLEPNHRRFPKSHTYAIQSVSVLPRNVGWDKSFEIRNWFFQFSLQTSILAHSLHQPTALTLSFAHGGVEIKWFKE